MQCVYLHVRCNFTDSMNTKRKGDKLEDKVYYLLKELLNNDEYYLNRKQSQVFKKKEYYSESRKSNIELDVTIESYLPNAEKYSTLHVFECKNLNKNVTPDDIEEFDSKLNQIGRHNTKGIMVSVKGFSKSTLNLAKSWGIGLLLIRNDNQLNWVNWRKKYTPLEFSNKTNEVVLALINNKVVNNFADILLTSGIIDVYYHSEKYIHIPYVTEEKIQSIVDRLYKYDIHDNYCLNIEKIGDFFKSRYPLEIDFCALEDNLLGKIEFEPLKISVSIREEENRQRFTFCHEIGHLILHNKLLTNRVDQKTDDESSLSLKFHTTEKSSKRLEIQANIFASHLLLPVEPIIKDVARYFVKENIKKGYLYLDKQPVNIFLVGNLLNELSLKYKASKEAIRIKLISLKLLRDESSFNFRSFLKKETF